MSSSHPKFTPPRVSPGPNVVVIDASPPGSDAGGKDQTPGERGRPSGPRAGSTHTQYVPAPRPVNWYEPSPAVVAEARPAVGHAPEPTHTTAPGRPASPPSRIPLARRVPAASIATQPGGAGLAAAGSHRSLHTRPAIEPLTTTGMADGVSAAIGRVAGAGSWQAPRAAASAATAPRLRAIEPSRARNRRSPCLTKRNHSRFTGDRPNGDFRRSRDVGVQRQTSAAQRRRSNAKGPCRTGSAPFRSGFRRPIRREGGLGAPVTRSRSEERAPHARHEAALSCTRWWGQTHERPLWHN